MADRVQQLLDLNTKKSVLRFNGQKFTDFVKAVPRNYSIVIMFTAMAPARQCVICRHAHDEYTILANSYRYSQTYSNGLFFAMVDFDEGSDIFQWLRLNTAPVFMHFPAKGKPKRKIEKFNSLVCLFIIHFPLQPPIHWTFKELVSPLRHLRNGFRNVRMSKFVYSVHQTTRELSLCLCSVPSLEDSCTCAATISTFCSTNACGACWPLLSVSQ